MPESRPGPAELPVPRPAQGSRGSAGWEVSGDRIVLRFRGAELRSALTPGFLATAAAVGIGAGLIAALAGRGATSAILTGALVLALVLAFVSFIRLSLNAHDVELSFGPHDLMVAEAGAVARNAPARKAAGGRAGRDDSGSGAYGLPLSEVTRILIVHDGAPARVRIRTRRRGFRWTIGGLYRHPTVEPFIEAVPDELGRRLEAAGLAGAMTTRRTIRFSDFRRSRADGGRRR